MDRQPIFDFHLRLVPRQGAVQRLLAVMDSCGIDHAVACAGGVIDLDLLSRQLIEGGHIEDDADNDATLEGCKQSGGRLVPFFLANPHRDPDRYRSRAHEFRGLELQPAVHGVPLCDERVTALVAVAAEFGHPVYVVCTTWPGCGVADLVELASRFPSVTFVLGHSGIGSIDLYGVRLIAPQRNIHFETSGGYMCVLAAALDRLGDDRVLFGSEYPSQHPSIELAKYRALDLSAKRWKAVTWRNALRLLKEESS
jgi:uncharacterized protein